MCGFSFGGCGGSYESYHGNSCGGSGCGGGFYGNSCGGSYESDEDYECQKCLEEGHKKKIKVNANSNEEICDAINRLKK